MISAKLIIGTLMIICALTNSKQFTNQDLIFCLGIALIASLFDESFKNKK